MQKIISTFIIAGAVILLSAEASRANTSGNTRFIVGQTLNSVYIAETFFIGTRDYRNISEGAAAAAGLATFYSSYSLTDKTNMPASRANFINSVSVWAAVWGLLSANMFDAEKDSMMMISSLTDGLATGGAVIASSGYTMSTDDTALINFSAFWGTAVIIETIKAIKPKSDSGLGKYIIWTAFTGSLTAGYFAAREYEVSSDRCIKTSLYGIMGAFSGAGFAWVMYFKSPRAYYVSLLAGTIIGLYGGWMLTDEPARQNRVPFKRSSDEAIAKFSLGSYTW